MNVVGSGPTATATYRIDLGSAVEANSGLFSVNVPAGAVKDAAGNLGTSGQSDCLGSFTSSGYNLESAADCAFRSAGDKQGSNPQLLPLAANGGPTNTMALNSGSPAIDTGDPACPPPGTDQRGVNRPQGARCDIGAYERSVPKTKTKKGKAKPKKP